ncbi:hypothetical protein BDU57DRAFT_159058 [Ampelomyces quisqualis]|uniref:Secreted protein n=1 Tax=Ampelomyces quisqualis TaxID=50730 RepID=A0A6A5QQW7_AMPQU|nr:hypothetical protein BDU57DRAFT_159058 [Ampelomyces quisqualis]
MFIFAIFLGLFRRTKAHSIAFPPTTLVLHPPILHALDALLSQRYTYSGPPVFSKSPQDCPPVGPSMQGGIRPN